MGPWEDQKVSTYRKIIDALEGARWDEAAQLGSYFVDEANVCFTLYRQWIGDLNGYLRDKDVAADVITARNEQAVIERRLGKPQDALLLYEEVLKGEAKPNEKREALCGGPGEGHGQVREEDVPSG